MAGAAPACVIDHGRSNARMTGPNRKGTAMFFDGKKWWCYGCAKFHPLSRDAEGEIDGRTWCLHSIKKAAKEGRNYRPRHPEVDGRRMCR